MEDLTNFLKKIYHRLSSNYKLSVLLSKELKSTQRGGQNIHRILDVGCGRLSSLRGIDKTGMYIVGLNFYKPYIQKLKNLSIYNECILGDVRKLTSIFKPKSFDCAVSIEVLEHLNKDDGKIMIEQMKTVSKEKIILTTPNGFLPTYAGPNDNPTEVHISGWSSAEFKKLGFKVYGLGGLKLFWKVEQGQAVIRFKPRKIFTMLAELSELFVYYFSPLAFRLLIVYSLEEKN